MTYDILKTLYTSVTVIDNTNGNIVYSHSKYPFDDIQIATGEQFDDFLKKYYDENFIPIFDKIVINNISYWINRKFKNNHIYYLIQECKYWDEMLEKAEATSAIDGLTECYTKTETEIMMKNLLYTFLRYQTNPFSIIMFDIDFFKKVNDTYGHLAGDYVLKQLASIVKTHLRESDICGRFGGEEFIIVLSQTKVNGAMRLANRLRESCQNFNFIFQGTKIDISISLGVTSVSISDSIHSLIDRCDNALYDAKKSGRNRVEYR